MCSSDLRGEEWLVQFALLQLALLRCALPCRGGLGGCSWRAWLPGVGSDSEDFVLRTGLLEDGWLQGGSAMAVRVHRARFRRLRRTAHAASTRVGCSLSGVWRRPGCFFSGDEEDALRCCGGAAFRFPGSLCSWPCCCCSECVLSVLQRACCSSSCNSQIGRAHV